MIASMRMQQRAEQVLSMEMQVQLQHMEVSKIASVVQGRAKRLLVGVCGNTGDAYHQVINDHNIDGIAARIARASVFRLANEGIFPNPQRQLNDIELIEHISDTVDSEFAAWWLESSRSKYIPVSQSPSERKFMLDNGNIDWSKVQTSRSMIASGRNVNQSDMYNAEGLQTNASLVVECVADVEHGFSIKPEMRAIFERVRTATYGAINRTNIDELFPKIRESYNRIWLQPATIELLRHNKPDQVRAFAKKLEEGVFVFGFDEKVAGNPSVGEEMYQNFTAESSHERPSYQGRYLMDDKGELLAWFTYWQTPNFESDQHRSMILQYLDHGVTGGEMQYKRDPPKKKFKPWVDQTIMIDTLCGGEVKGAGTRLMAKVVGDIYRHNRRISTLLGYRIFDIQMHPAFRGFKDPIRMTENISSSDFFEDRGCATFAYDMNRKGPKSVRQLSDGTTMLLDPQWVAFNGSFPVFMERSRQKWKNIQNRYGDVSEDF